MWCICAALATLAARESSLWVPNPAAWSRRFHPVKSNTRSSDMLIVGHSRSASAVARPNLGAAWADGAAAAVLACLCSSLLTASPCSAFAASAMAAEPAALSQAASSPVADETWALLDKYYLDRSFNGLSWPAERQRLRR